MRMITHRWLSTLVLVCIFLSAALAFGQSETATLSGLVTDPQGKAVPAVAVVVTNVATNISASTKTNSAGFYSVTSLKPGHYLVSCTKPGFKRVDVTDLVLNAQDSISRNVQLEVGSVATSVTVTAEASQVNTTDASVSTVVDRGFVENMPLNGRSLQSLIQLTPGVVLAKPNVGDPGQFSVNGQRTDANYFTVDGVSANIDATSNYGELGVGALPSLSTAGGTNSLVSIDAMQEFKIQTSTFAPEYGRTPGAQISIVTRSGGNQFHGTGFDYVRNNVLDAADWFVNADSLAKPEERQNDFGGVLGGPIIKNRLFFFFSYEGLRLRLPLTGTVVVPSTTLRSETPAIIQPLMNAFPQPNTSNNGPLAGVFDASYSDPSSLNATSIRMDYAVTSKINLFGRFNHGPSHMVSKQGSLTDVARWDAAMDTVTTGATFTLKPNLLDEFRFNYSRTTGGNVNFMQSFGGGVAPSDAYLSQLYPLYKAGDDIEMILTLPGTTDMRWYTGQYINIQHQLNFVDTLAWTLGPHALKAGFDYRRMTPIFDYASYGAAPYFESLSDVTSLTPTEVTDYANDSPFVHPLVQNLSLYAQDTWKTTPNLTLTYGVRWDYNPPAADTGSHGLFTAINLNDPANATIAPKGTPLWKATHDNFAPRLGAAYTLRRTPGRELVMRGGSGIFYDLGNNNGLQSAIGFPNERWKYLYNVPFPLSIANATPYPETLNPPFGTAYAFLPNLKLPLIYQWNLSLQQSLGPNQSVSATYVGAKGRRLLDQEEDTPAAGLNPNFSALYITTNEGHSNYDALQLQYERRLSHGLQMTAFYAWGHDLDNISITGYKTVTPYYTLYNHQLDYGNSDNDARQTLSTALSYNIPTPGKSRPLRAIAGSWALDSLFRAFTPLPVNVLSGLVLPGMQDGQYWGRPDVVPNQPFYLHGSQYPGGKAINPAAFQDPASPGAQGDLARNALRGFGAWEEDLTIRREFPIHEQIKLQFRAEFFNIFNHPDFGDPGTEFNGTDMLTSPLFGQSIAILAKSSYLSGFGQITNPLYAMGGPRSIQLALKLIF